MIIYNRTSYKELTLKSYQKEKRRLQIAKTHLREVKRFARRMENDMIVLQEKLNILEESKGDE